MSEKLSSMISSLYETKTISPSYKIPQIIYTLMLFGREPEGLGRYRIKNEVGLGEGSVKTLLKRLKEEKIIRSLPKKQNGHVLTKSGKVLHQNIVELIKFPKLIMKSKKKLVIGKVSSFTLVKKKNQNQNQNQNQNKNINIGITQRDEAIKIGGTGATCLVFKNGEFIFPKGKYFPVLIKDIDLNELKKGDIVVIGGGKDRKTSFLATIAAALSLVDITH